MHKIAVGSYNEKTLSNTEAQPSRIKRAWRSSLGTLSGATLLASLTRLLCPACWPAYAGVMSSLGLGFLMQKVWLMPLTIITLLFVISSLAYRANSRRGFGPFLLGLLGSAALLGGQFIFPSFAAGDVVFEWMIIAKWSIDAGAVLLVVASIWNGWPRKSTGVELNNCLSCSLETTGA